MNNGDEDDDRKMKAIAPLGAASRGATNRPVLQDMTNLAAASMPHQQHVAGKALVWLEQQHKKEREQTEGLQENPMGSERPMASAATMPVACIKEVPHRLPSDDLMGTQQPQLLDIDHKDKGDPLAAAEYVDDILAFYRTVEPISSVPADFMAHQTEIDDQSRAMLISCVVEHSDRLFEMPETLYIAINLIDRFLAVSKVQLRNLLLVGITAMYMAGKYQEKKCQDIHSFTRIAEHAYSTANITSMELEIWRAVQYNLSLPTPYTFLVPFLKAALSSMSSSKASTLASNANIVQVILCDEKMSELEDDGPSNCVHEDTEMQQMAFLLVELSLLECSQLRFSPSHLAASAVYVAMLTTRKGRGEAAGSDTCWSHLLESHTGYTEAQLRQCALKMSSLRTDQPIRRYVDKVVHDKYKEVAKLPKAFFP